MEKKQTAILLIHCPDKQGILAAVTDFINVNKGNIVYLDQHVDYVQNTFFMRVEWDLKDFIIPRDKIEEYFRTLYANKYDMVFTLNFSDVKPRMAIFVSKMSHCLFDILSRYLDGGLNVEIPMIVSNHADLQWIGEKFGIPFHVFPITKENKLEQEKKEMELLRSERVDFIVLARYMQIISEDMINEFPNNIINIHISRRSTLSIQNILLPEICKTFWSTFHYFIKSLYIFCINNLISKKPFICLIQISFQSCFDQALQRKSYA